MIVAFELQTYHGGNWRIDSLFNDHRLAVMEARRLSAARRFKAVRLVEEKYDPDTQSSTSRVIYRVSRLEGQNADPSGRRRQVETRAEVAERAIQAAGAGRRAQALQRRREREAASLVNLQVLRFGAAFLFGLALLYAIDVLAR